MEHKVRKLVLQLVALPGFIRKSIVIALDLVVFVAAVWVAYWLRLGEWELYTRRVLVFAGIALATWIAVASITKTYRSVIRFSGRQTVLALMRACIIMSLVLAVALQTARIDGLPRTLAAIHPILFFLGLVGSRIAISNLIFEAIHGARRPTEPKRVLIYGAGWAGQQLDASMRQEPGLRVIGFIDANESLRNNVLEGKRIWHTEDLGLVLAMERVDEVFLAIPSAKRSLRRSIVERINQCDNRIRVRILPTLSQIASGRVSISDLRKVEIEELLGRDEVPPDPELMARNIRNKRVVVTGAGGSIGSELCRQIIKQEPSCLILAEQSEHGLYKIDIELKETIRREGLHIDVRTELVNLVDSHSCERLMRNHLPDTLYHAAAYKHVPLVETNPLAGIRNNIIGTLNTCLFAEKAGVSKFILVSTDKAVRPTNVMGASKRACELIAQARAEAQQQTRYSCVRFGNVLGSSGSVIPLFRKQIAAGGPITITHPDATRYFMTISEASQLVIQAGALADRGEILLLDMGQPVRILDLARLMIELSGLSVADDKNPDGEIAIQEIGLRPGEKLIEELLISASSETTAHPRIIEARESKLDWSALELLLSDLCSALQIADTNEAIRILTQIVPEFVCGHASTIDQHSRYPSAAIASPDEQGVWHVNDNLTTKLRRP